MSYNTCNLHYERRILLFRPPSIQEAIKIGQLEYHHSVHKYKFSSSFDLLIKIRILNLLEHYSIEFNSSFYLSLYLAFLMLLNHSMLTFSIMLNGIWWLCNQKQGPFRKHLKNGTVTGINKCIGSFLSLR